MAFEGFAKMVNGKPRWTGKVALMEDRLTEPLKWRKPARIFACSMSDLFHENLPDEAIDKVFAVMALCPQHTFQILTKRPERMQRYMTYLGNRDDLIADHALRLSGWPKNAAPGRTKERRDAIMHRVRNPSEWKGLWLGTSVEDQARADERIPLLRKTPVATRFLSCEPLLGPLNIREHLVGQEEPGRVGNATGWTPPIDLVIIGGESGPRARPFNVSWARSLIEQCRGTDAVPFVKQLGRRPYWDRLNGCGKWPELTRINLDGKQVDAVSLKDKKGGDMAEWAEDLRVRELPA
jgi:protein gp37